MKWPHFISFYNKHYCVSGQNIFLQFIMAGTVLKNPSIAYKPLFVPSLNEVVNGKFNIIDFLFYE